MIAFNTKNLLYILLILTIIFIVIKFVKPYVSKKFIENYQEINKPFFPRIKKIKISKNGGYKDINMSGINLQNSSNRSILNWYNADTLLHSNLYPGTNGLSIFSNTVNDLTKKPHPTSFHSQITTDDARTPFVEIGTSSLDILDDLQFINIIPRGDSCCYNRISNINIHLIYDDANNQEQEYIINSGTADIGENINYRKIKIDRTLKQAPSNVVIEDIPETVEPFKNISKSDLSNDVYYMYDSNYQ